MMSGGSVTHCSARSIQGVRITTTTDKDLDNIADCKQRIRRSRISLRRVLACCRKKNNNLKTLVVILTLFFHSNAHHLFWLCVDVQLLFATTGCCCLRGRWQLRRLPSFNSLMFSQQRIPIQNEFIPGERIPLGDSAGGQIKSVMTRRFWRRLGSAALFFFLFIETRFSRVHIYLNDVSNSRWPNVAPSTEMWTETTDWLAVFVLSLRSANTLWLLHPAGWLAAARHVSPVFKPTWLSWMRTQRSDSQARLHEDAAARRVTELQQ